MFDKILVPIDGSDQSWNALDTALKLGEKFGSEILAVHIIQPFYNAGFLAIPVDNRLLTSQMDDMQENAEQMLNIAKEKVGKYSNKFSTKIEKGHPSERIIAISEEEKCSLIVIGSRGLSGITEFLLGSVSSNVSQYSKIPVLIVKNS